MTASRPIKALLRARSGVSALEFAIVAPALLMLGLGVLEYGRLTWTIQALTSVATKGARCMAVQATQCASAGIYNATSTKTFIESLAGTWLVSIPDTAVTLNRAATCAGVAGFSQVTISSTFQTVLPLTMTSLTTSVPVKTQVCFPNQS